MRHIVKFLTNEANKKEIEDLEVWIDDKVNQTTFEQYVKLNFLINASMQKYNINKAKQDVDSKITRITKKRIKNRFQNWAIAAALLFIFGLGIILNITTNTVKITSVQSDSLTDIAPGTDKAVLTLENGEQIILENDRSLTAEKYESDGKSISYKSKSTTTKDINYNYLTIPRAGKFLLQLSDGTKVWLNSDSKIKYPTNFIKGETRKIELLYGEAYLDVSPSNLHDDTGFVVVSKSQQVEVLGTQFNINAYPENRVIKTTLVEGSISLSINKANKLLVPNQQSVVNDSLDYIQIKSVDVNQEIAWVKGNFSFDEMPLKEISKILSRWYDVDFIFINEKAENIKFTGLLERTESVEDILTIITRTTNNEISYEIGDKNIIIK